jgi:hypothetical protein
MRSWSEQGHVRYWHLADIGLRDLMSAFGGKAGTIGPEGQCPLLTQSGHWAGCLRPNPQPLPPPSSSQFEPVRWLVLSLGGLHETADFITLLGGAAAAWPFTVRAQQPLDSMIDKLIDCRCAAEVGTLLASVSPGTV